MSNLKRRAQPTGESKKMDGDYNNSTPGDHEGRLVMVADLGLHQDEYQGEKKKPAQKISLGLEIVDEDVQINGEMQPRLMWTRPFNVFATLTEKGKEMEYYEVFEPNCSPGEVPDWESQLGKPCNVVIEHVEKNGKTYDNVKNVTPIPRKYQDNVPENKMETGVGDADDENNPVNQKLHGLAKYAFNNRLSEEDVEKPTAKISDTKRRPSAGSGFDDAPEQDPDFDDDIPF